LCIIELCIKNQSRAAAAQGASPGEQARDKESAKAFLAARRLAREIALHLIFQLEPEGDAEALLARALTPEAFEDLAGESELYTVLPTGSHLAYIRKAVTAVAARRAELDGLIAGYAVGWNLDRISRVTACILRLCMVEIDSLKIPMKASVNEALELAKRYDSAEAAQFVNGILASFIRDHALDGDGDA
jgi:N utilization substance protein B